jgi:hypothetical protein
LGADGNQKFGIPGGQPIAGLSSIGLGRRIDRHRLGGHHQQHGDNKFIYYNNLTWQKGKHLLKMGGSSCATSRTATTPATTARWVCSATPVPTPGLDLRRLPDRRVDSQGPRRCDGHLGPPLLALGVVRAGRLEDCTELHLNLGLRWEYMQPIYEVADRQVNVNTFTGQLITPGGEFGRALYKGYPYQFMPRIGFAWTPGNNKLVVRAGYAYQSFMEGTGANLRTAAEPAVLRGNRLLVRPADAGNHPDRFRGRGRGQHLRLDMPRPAGVTVPQLQGRAWDLNLRPQQTSQVNFTLEYQLDQRPRCRRVTSARRVPTWWRRLKPTSRCREPARSSTWANLNTRRPLANILPNLGNIARTESSARWTTTRCR